MFATAIYSHPSLLFVSLGAYHKGGMPLKAPLWQAPALPAHLRIEWKRIVNTNTLAYYDTATITAAIF